MVIQTTDEVAAQIRDGIEAAISQTVPILPKAFIDVLAKVLAGVFVILLKYCGFIFLQLFVSTASSRPTEINGRTITPLIERGREVGLGDPEPATQAQLSVEVTVLTQTGSLKAGMQLLRSETGILYEVVAPVALDAATVPVTIRAIGDQDGGDGSGTIGNLVAGDAVSFVNPPATIERETTVLSQVVTAADAEDPEAYRRRVLRKKQRPPQGGAHADYWGWATSVEGIINAYPYAGLPGEIDLYIEASEESSGDPDGIPTNAQKTAVFDYINDTSPETGLARRRPVNDAVNVLPITRTEFDLVLAGLEAVDVDALKTSIEVAVDEYLRAREPYIQGLSSLPRDDRITQGAIAGVVEDVVNADGSSVVSIQLKKGGLPVSAYILGNGEKAKRGTVTLI